MTDIGMVLGRLGHTLVTGVAPKLEGDYSGGHAAMAGFMSVMAGEAWDGAADRLVNEIAGMRGLFALAGHDPATPESTTVKVSDLTVERDALARQLIELQTLLEAKDDEASKAINTKIWMHLMATTMSRMPSPPDFPDPEPS